SSTQATIRRTRWRSRRSADGPSPFTSAPSRPSRSTGCAACATSRRCCIGWRPRVPRDAMTPRTATRPFRFAGCVELRQTLDVHALDERELMNRIAEVPAGSIFFHTFGYFLRHRAFTPAYGNDFARWAALEVGDHALAERLAVVDPFSFATLEQLREHLASIVQDHLRGREAERRVEFERGFPFQQPHIVEVPLGHTAETLVEFRAGLAGVDESAIYLHT